MDLLCLRPYRSAQRRRTRDALHRLHAVSHQNGSVSEVEPDRSARIQSSSCALEGGTETPHGRGRRARAQHSRAALLHINGIRRPDLEQYESARDGVCTESSRWESVENFRLRVFRAVAEEMSFRK